MLSFIKSTSYVKSARIYTTVQLITDYDLSFRKYIIMIRVRGSNIKIINLKRAN